jgi:hypothetical protein
MTVHILLGYLSKKHILLGIKEFVFNNMSFRGFEEIPLSFRKGIKLREFSSHAFVQSDSGAADVLLGDLDLLSL